MDISQLAAHFDIIVFISLSNVCHVSDPLTQKQRHNNTQHSNIVSDRLLYVECCFQTVTLQTYLRKQGSSITSSIRSATKWKPCILCSYPDSMTAFKSFIDTTLTYLFILCYYIVQGNKYRPGGSNLNPNHSPWIWKQPARSRSRNKCTTLPDEIAQ